MHVRTLLLLTLTTGLAQAQDLTIRTRDTLDGFSSRTETLYIHNDRMREEITEQTRLGSRSYVAITQCDWRREVSVEDNNRFFTIHPMNRKLESLGRFNNGTASGTFIPAGHRPKLGTLTTTVQFTDTGERKEIGGLVLRHVKETYTQEATPGLAIHTWNTERDVWYADLPPTCRTPVSMSISGTGAYSIFLENGDSQLQVKFTGDQHAAKGVPLIANVVATTSSGQKTNERLELLEVSHAPLQPSLFEIPQGYRVTRSHPRDRTWEQSNSVPNRVAAWWRRLCFSVKKSV